MRELEPGHCWPEFPRKRLRHGSSAPCFAASAHAPHEARVPIIPSGQRTNYRVHRSASGTCENAKPRTRINHPNRDNGPAVTPIHRSASGTCGHAKPRTRINHPTGATDQQLRPSIARLRTPAEAPNCVRASVIHGTTDQYLRPSIAPLPIPAETPSRLLASVGDRCAGPAATSIAPHRIPAETPSRAPAPAFHRDNGLAVAPINESIGRPQPPPTTPRTRIHRTTGTRAQHRRHR